MRHQEERCPFCAGALAAMSAEEAMVPRARRAVVALGAAVVTGVLAGCDPPRPAPVDNPPHMQPPQPQPQPPQPNVNDPGAVAAVYGAPPPNPAANAPDAGAMQPPTPMMTRYGAPPAFDGVV